MKHLQPIHNILTTLTGPKTPESSAVKTGQSLDLEGVEKAIQGFDAYLKAAASSADMNGLASPAQSKNLSGQAQELLQSGKDFPLGGKNMPGHSTL